MTDERSGPSSILPGLGCGIALGAVGWSMFEAATSGTVWIVIVWLVCAGRVTRLITVPALRRRRVGRLSAVAGGAVSAVLFLVALVAPGIPVGLTVPWVPLLLGCAALAFVPDAPGRRGRAVQPRTQ